MADRAATFREHWGVKFPVVAHGLAEDEVVAYVNELIEKLDQAEGQHDKHASLLRLAEQTVVEAENMALEIKERARKQVEAEAAKVREQTLAQANQEAAEMRQAAEVEAATKSREMVEKANAEAQSLLAKARREAQMVLEESRAHVESIESQARLEGEFVVRRMTQNVAEGLRRAVFAETTNTILPTLDQMVSQLRAEFRTQEAPSKVTHRTTKKG